MSFPIMKLTEAGKTMLAKAHSGEPLNFTRISIGSGVLSDTTASPSSLVKEEFSLQIAQIHVNEGIAHITAMLDNSGITEGFYWREIGLYSGNVLYAYANSGEHAEYIPAYTTASFYRTKIGIAVIVSDTANVTASLGEYAGYVTYAEFDKHLCDNNPHGITLETIGLRISKDGNLLYLSGERWKAVQQQPNIYFHGTGYTGTNSITVTVYECTSEEQIDETTYRAAVSRQVINGEVSLTVSVGGCGNHRAVIFLNHNDGTTTAYTHERIITITDAATYSIEI